MSDRIRIGIIEDDDELRAMIVGLLEDLDHDVVFAEGDASDLVDSCAAAAPDIVILDQRLPVISGLEAAATLIAARPDIPVAVLSAYDDRGLQEAASRIGVRRYLVKGCSAAELDAAIRSCTSGASIEEVDASSGSVDAQAQ